jgi:hypothetical protein
MTVTLNIRPEVEAGLLAQAQIAGMTVEEYLLYLFTRRKGRDSALSGARIGEELVSGTGAV